MARRIRITTGNVSATATLDESPTARAIWSALPIDAKAQAWGDEIYFGIPVAVDEDGARAPQSIVEPGDLGYWPPGRAFCVFFGPTPASEGDEIRPASPVNVFGRVDGDPKPFKPVRSGTPVRLERLDAEETESRRQR